MCTDNGYTDKDTKEANDEKNKTDEKMKNGIILDRSCTDVIMCIIFTVFFFGCFGTAAYGYAEGDPVLLITPYDSDGNICGITDGYDNYLYQYWTDLTDSTPDLAITVCVSACPKNYTTVDCKTTEATVVCPVSYFETKLYLSRYCIPTDSDLLSKVEDFFGSTKLAKYFGDLATCWWVFLVMMGISTIISMIYCFLLRLFAKPIIYLSFIIILVLLFAGGFYCFFTNNEYLQSDSTQDMMKGMGILLWILTAVYLIILLCCCSRIKLGVAIMQAASDFVRNTIGVFFVPLIFFVIIGFWVTFWVVSAVYLYSVGEPEKDDVYPITTINWPETTQYLFIYHIFALFWVSAFIIGCAQFIIAATACIWYFEQGAASDVQAKTSFMTAYKWIFKYHLGSIAFGSLIIAILQMIKLIFEYVRVKFEKTVPQNFCTKCLMCCVRCIIWCLDSCVRCITKNAYIQIALTSNNFCTAVWHTFYLLVRNAGRFTTVSSIGWILMFVGKAFIMACSGFIGYLIIMESALADEVNSPIFPVICIIIIAMLIGSIFLSVFSFSATAILHCYILDEEIGGTHTPQSLNEFKTVNDEQNAKKKNKKGGSGGSSNDNQQKGDDDKKANDVA